MSVSSRSTKAAMYSEIERLRALCDLQTQQLRALEAKIEELSAARPEPTPRPAPEHTDRGTRMLMTKRLAITCKASVKWVDGQGFQQYKDGGWIAVPTRTVEFVAKGIGQ